MNGPRLERIFASTALALILAALTGASATAQDTGPPTAATSSETAAAAGAAALGTRETAPAAASEATPAPKDAAVPAPASGRGPSARLGDIVAKGLRLHGSL